MFYLLHVLFIILPLLCLQEVELVRAISIWYIGHWRHKIPGLYLNDNLIDCLCYTTNRQQFIHNNDPATVYTYIYDIAR